MDVLTLEYPLQTADERAIGRFVFGAYGGIATFKFPDRWRWLYGRGAVSLVTVDSSGIFGHLGCVPFTAKQNGGRVAGAWTLDLYVNPSYRRSGYAKRLQAAVQRAQSASMSLWCSNIARSIKLSLGYRPVAELCVLTKSSRSCRQRMQVEVTHPDPSEIAAAAAKYLASWDFYVERSVPYCVWRFLDQPYAAYRQMVSSEGVALARVCGPMRKGEGMIGDVFPSTDSLSSRQHLINGAAQALFDAGCVTVRFGSTDLTLASALCTAEWRVTEVYRLFAAHTVMSGRVFLSLSDHDIDQYPW